MKRIFTLLKFLLIFFLGSIIIARLFFPNLMQELVIKPALKLPIFGKVLGVTWEKSAEITPFLTQKTVELADKVESSDLGINEAIEKAVSDKNVSQSVSATIESGIEHQVSQLKDMPAEVLQQVESGIRKEIYRQICTGWLEATGSAENQ